MAVKSIEAAKEEVKVSPPRAYASKHTDGIGQHSHWCIWTSLSGGARLATGKTPKEAWNDAAAAVERKKISEDKLEAESKC